MGKRLFQKTQVSSKQVGIKLAIMTVIIALVLLMIPASMIFADDTGARSPSATTNQDYIPYQAAWVNYPNAMTSNDSYAVATGQYTQTYSKWLKAMNFGFSIPANAVITGISANVERKQSITAVGGTGPGWFDAMVCLVRNGSPVTASNRVSGPAYYWPLTEEVKTFGGTTDMWGQSLTPADINNGNFGFAILAGKAATSSSSYPFITPYAYVDYMSMTVYYTLPDTTPPVIDAMADITVEATSSAGATVDFSPTATDNVDASVTVVCSPASGSTFPLGTTQVTCNAADSAGNAAIPVTFNVIVQDTTAPVITVTGDNPTNVSYGDTYNEQGATWSDAVDGSGSANISGDTVDANTLGTYTIKYNYTDTAGNAAAEVTRTVNVVDITKPIITLNGAAIVNIENGATYDELGAVWNDNVDGTGSAVVSGDTVNTSLLGTYIVKYNYTDSSGNAADEVIRTVNVIDTQKPVITLLGNSDVTIEVFSIYSDAGATAFDTYDGDLTGNIITSNPVDVNVLGDYIVTYNVSDSSGNSADEVSRTVHVVDTTAPVITILGSNPVNIYIGDLYNDEGAAAADNVDGDITANIITTNNVDTSIKGTYTVVYAVSDASGNKTTATRTVNVLNHPPVAVDDGFAYINAGTINIPTSLLLANDYDPEGDPISFVSISQGTGGIATYSSFQKRVTFRPTRNFKGLASFSYTIKDSNGLQASATVWLSIAINELPNNLPPIAAPDTLSTNKVMTTISIPNLLANDSDPEGTAISFVSAGNASNNARLISAFGQLLLVVRRGYTGTITFPYTIKDASGLRATGIVTVNVTNARLF